MPPQAGVLEEMVDDAMDALDDEEDEDAADEEVQRVMTELNADVFGTSKATATHEPAVAQAEEEDEDEEDMAAMRQRLEQLKG